MSDNRGVAGRGVSPPSGLKGTDEGKAAGERAREQDRARNELIVRIHSQWQSLKNVETAYLEIVFRGKRERFEQLSDSDRFLLLTYFETDRYDPGAGLKPLRKDINALQELAYALGFDILRLKQPKAEPLKRTAAEQLAAYNARVEALRSGISAGLLIFLGDVMTRTTQGRSISTAEIDYALAFGQVVDMGATMGTPVVAKMQRVLARSTAAKGTETPSTAAGPIAPKPRPPAPPPSTPATSTGQSAKPPASGARAAPPPSSPTGGTLTKLRQLKIDVDDPYTMRAIREIFRDNRNSGALLTHTRAGSGELRALVRAGKEADVKRVRFLAPGNAKGDRTPDIEVVYRDESRLFIEVRTVTGARRGAQVRDAPQQRAKLSPLFEQSVEQKLRHGQISATNPGRVVFHAPFETINSTALEGWREMLGRIIKRSPMPEGIGRIEVTGGTNGAMLIFQPPGWKGVLVK